MYKYVKLFTIDCRCNIIQNILASGNETVLRESWPSTSGCDNYIHRQTATRVHPRAHFKIPPNTNFPKRPLHFLTPPILFISGKQDLARVRTLAEAYFTTEMYIFCIRSAFGPPHVWRGRWIIGSVNLPGLLQRTVSTFSIVEFRLYIGLLLKLKTCKTSFLGGVTRTTLLLHSCSNSTYIYGPSRSKNWFLRYPWL